jgi:hypothetical protein
MPREVVEFFKGEKPDVTGVLVDIEKTPACKLHEEEMQNGFEIDIAKLPPDVKIIRFVNSW